MPADPRDYKLDISSLAGQDSYQNAQRRPFLSVLFDCCQVYQRVYRSADGKSYRGRCPKCGNPVQFIVGQGGTTARYFRAR